MTHTHTHTETYTHLPLCHWHTLVIVTDTHQHIDRGLYTYMTSYLAQAYRLSILIDMSTLFINSWLMRLSLDNVSLINTRNVSIVMDKSIPLSIGISMILQRHHFVEGFFDLKKSHNVRPRNLWHLLKDPSSYSKGNSTCSCRNSTDIWVSSSPSCTSCVSTCLNNSLNNWWTTHPGTFFYTLVGGHRQTQFGQEVPVTVMVCAGLT
jgi:hypothetical protein